MFCDSNDATLTSCRHACFENTHAKRSTYFGQKSWFPHEYRINVRIYKLSIKWRSGDVLRFQRHNPHLMSTRLLREHSCQMKHLFWQKSWFPHGYRINVRILNSVLNGAPGMFCDSNDTTLTSCRHACFENNHDKQSTYFGQKSRFPHEYRINVRIFKFSIKWRSGDVLWFQRPNPHFMSTRLLREHSLPNEALILGKNHYFPVSAG